MKKDQRKRLVVFAILMENGDGIVDKSPAYIEEKFAAAVTVLYPEQLLHPINRVKLKEWTDKWG